MDGSTKKFGADSVITHGGPETMVRSMVDFPNS